MRQVLQLYLVVALGGVYLLEQAASSLMIEHDRFRQFRSDVPVFPLCIDLRVFDYIAVPKHVNSMSCDDLTIKVYHVWWWMKLMGGTTPKRHIAHSSSPYVKKLWCGRLTGWTRLPD